MCRRLNAGPGGSPAGAGSGFKTICEFETPHRFDLGRLSTIYDPFQIRTRLFQSRHQAASPNGVELYICVVFVMCRRLNGGPPGGSRQRLLNNV